MPPDRPAKATREIAGVEVQGPSESVDIECMSDREQLWFTPLLVFLLVSIALIAASAGERSDLQTFGAILAVFLGAVTILRRELGPWFQDPATPRTLDMDIPVTSGGFLVIAVGAGFLIA
jgi:hypothetical protein